MQQQNLLSASMRIFCALSSVTGRKTCEKRTRGVSICVLTISISRFQRIYQAKKRRTQAEMRNTLFSRIPRNERKVNKTHQKSQQNPPKTLPFCKLFTKPPFFCGNV